MKTLHVDMGREMRGGQWQALYLIERMADATLLAPEASPLMTAARRRGIEAHPLSILTLQELARTSDLLHAHDARAHTLLAAWAGKMLMRQKSARTGDPVDAHEARPHTLLTALTGKLVASRRVGFPVKRSILSRWKYRQPELYLAVSRYVALRLIHAGVHEEMIRVVHDGVPIPPRTSTLQPGRVVSLASKPIAIPGIPIHLTTDLWQDLSTAGVFVYRSEMEGLGSAALAAMAAGVPVIASHVGGLPEAVEHERTGLLVSDDDFATPIRRLLDNPAEAAEMGRRGRERVEQKFTIDIMVQKTKAAYEEILG